MATTPVPAFIAPPDFPALSDRALGTYNSKAFAWAEAMQDTTGPNIHAIAVTAKANADDAVLSAAAAAAQVPLAAEQVALAAAEAVTAQLAANAATATAGAVQWVSGTTYTAGDCVWSPLNLQVYRRITAGAGTTDPSADGTNWSFVGAKPSLVRSARTSNTPIGAADLATLIDITSGTFTQTFDSAASLGSGWYCYLRNSGTGDVTLDPSGAETIDGLANFVMYPGECRLVQCDGAALRSVVLNSFYKVFAASGDFIKPPGYTRFDIMLWAGGGSGSRGAASSIRTGGGGGGCAVARISAISVLSTAPVVIGAGGSGVAADSTNGNAGGDSSFAGINAYGGPGGVASDASNDTGARGGSAFLKTTVGSGRNDALSGGTNSAPGYFGGASGAGQVGSGLDFASTVYGGAGGRGISASNNTYAATISVFGGAGGSTNTAGTTPGAGSAPGGGGGASTDGTGSGAGARGELRIWGVI